MTWTAAKTFALLFLPHAYAGAGHAHGPQGQHMNVASGPEPQMQPFPAPPMNVPVPPNMVPHGPTQIPPPMQMQIQHHCQQAVQQHLGRWDQVQFNQCVQYFTQQPMLLQHQQQGYHTHDDGTQHAGPPHTGGHGSQPHNPMQHQQQGYHTHDDGTQHAGPPHTGGHGSQPHNPMQHQQQQPHVNPALTQQWESQCQQMVQQQLGYMNPGAWQQCMRWQYEQWTQRHNQTPVADTTQMSPQDSGGLSGLAVSGQQQQWQQQCNSMIQQQLGYFDQNAFAQCMQWLQSQQQPPSQDSHTHADGSVHSNHAHSPGDHDNQDPHSQHDDFSGLEGSVHSHTPVNLTPQWQRECSKMINEQLGYFDRRVFDQCMEWQHQQNSMRGMHMHNGVAHTGHA